jgi:hypothetical protein
MRETTVGVVAPAYVNVPLWVAQQRGFLERRGLRATEQILGVTGLIDRPPLSMIAVPRHRTFGDLRGGRIGTSPLEPAASAAAHTSAEPGYAWRACQTLACAGVIPRGLRATSRALAEVTGALRSSGLIPPGEPDPAAVAVDRSYRA